MKTIHYIPSINNTSLDSLPSPTTIKRNKIKPAQAYTQKTPHTRLSHTPVDPELKIEYIENIIVPSTEKRVVDLEGELIGEIRHTHPRVTPSSSIYVGTTDIIKGVGFEFSKEQFSNQYALKLVAYLSEKATTRVRTYFIQQEKKNRKQKRSRQRGLFKQASHHGRKTKLVNIQPKLTGKQIQARLNTHSSRDLTIEGLEAHLDLRGKIDLYIAIPEIYNYQAFNEMSQKQKELIKERLLFSPEKKWIAKTDNEFNAIVASGVQALSTIIEKTIGKYEN